MCRSTIIRFQKSSIIFQLSNLQSMLSRTNAEQTRFELLSFYAFYHVYVAEIFHRLLWSDNSTYSETHPVYKAGHAYETRGGHNVHRDRHCLICDHTPWPHSDPEGPKARGCCKPASSVHGSVRQRFNFQAVQSQSNRAEVVNTSHQIIYVKGLHITNTAFKFSSYINGNTPLATDNTP